MRVPETLIFHLGHRLRLSLIHFCNDNDVLLFFEHDAFEELGLVHQTDRGIKLKSTLKLLDL